MSGLKKFLIGLLVTLLFMSSLGLAWSYVGLKTVHNKETVKGWLHDSGFYNSVVDAALSNVKETASDETGNPEAAASLANDEGLKTVAKKVFNPEFLQTNTEKVLDGVYAWLDGTTANPTFRIDLSSAKQQFAEGIGQYATERVGKLPTCTPEQVSADFDALSAACLPPGVTPQQAGQKIAAEFQSNEKFLNKTTLDSSDINIQENGQSVPLGSSRQGKLARKAYQVSSSFPLIFGGLALVAAIGILFLSQTKARGLRRIGITWTVTGLVLAISYLALGRGTSFAESKAHSTANTDSIGDILVKLVQAVTTDFRQNLLWFVIGFLAAGVALIMLSIIMSRPQSSGDDEPDGIPMPKRSAAPPATEEKLAPEAKPVAKPTTAPTLPKNSAPTSAAKRPPRKIQL